MNDLNDLHSDVLDSAIDWRDHGFPDHPGATVRTVADHRWRVLDGDFSLPMLVLRQDALTHNLDAMAGYCARHGVLLAPHGKTHMSPQLWWRQERAGAWAVTAATVSQARIYLRTGAHRILIANEVLADEDLRWLCGVRRTAPAVELIVLVDSLEAVGIMDDAVRRFSPTAPIDVLIELGYHGGRAGCRTNSEAVELAEGIAASRGLRLRGIEGFEGVMPGADRAERVSGVVRYLDRAARTLEELLRRGLVHDPIATFGGSAHFDLVVAAFAGRSWPRTEQVRTVLRSGCYLTHDHGLYAESGPELDDESLRPALELWAVVISLPEPGIAIVGMGKRDAPVDSGLPIPLAVRRDGTMRAATDIEVFGLNDQHAYLRVGPRTNLQLGDQICFGISHPCTAFDKWRLIPIVDDAYQVVDAVRSYF